MRIHEQAVRGPLLVPALFFVTSTIAWGITLSPAGGLPRPIDGFMFIGQMLASPQLWLGTLAGMSAWRFSGLARARYARRAASRGAIVVAARPILAPVVAAVVSLACVYVTATLVQGLAFHDAYLLVVVAALGVVALTLGAAAGVWLPRLVAIPMAFVAASMFAYLPVTMKAAWVRSLVGGGWPPQEVYRVSNLTVLGSLLFAASVITVAVVALSRRASANYSLTLPAATLCIAVALSGAAASSVRSLGYIPLEAREIPEVCSDSTPTWCVAPWNVGDLSTFTALNGRITEIEKETGAKFPARLSQVPPSGPIASNNVDAMRPLRTGHDKGSSFDVSMAATAAAAAAAGLMPSCPSRDPNENSLAQFLVDEWWQAKLQGKEIFTASYFKDDEYALAVKSMSPKEQGRWINALMALPWDCKTLFVYPEFDSAGKVSLPTSATGFFDVEN